MWVKQCWGSMTFWYGSGSADSYLWLMDPDPTPDLTPFFSDYVFPYFFLFHKRERSGGGSGSVHLTNGSGSWRPKNMRIRIPNTGFKFNVCQRFRRPPTPSRSCTAWSRTWRRSSSASLRSSWPTGQAQLSIELGCSLSSVVHWAQLFTFSLPFLTDIDRFRTKKSLRKGTC